MSIRENDVRRRGRDRITAVTTGLVVAGGAGTIAVVAALAVGHQASAAVPPPTGASTDSGATAGSTAGRGTAPHTRSEAPQPGGGLAPGDGGQSQAQSGGS